MNEISATQIVMLILSISIIIFLAYWVVNIFQARKSIGQYKYTRGFNMTLDSKNPKPINLQCEGDSVICVDKATLICTCPNSLNIESSNLPPFDPTPANYGAFNPKTTLDVTSHFTPANGNATFSVLSSAVYTNTINGTLCKCADGDDGNIQLIGTYTCVAPGTHCGSS